jgi:hypothetical protein
MIDHDLPLENHRSKNVVLHLQMTLVGSSCKNGTTNLTVDAAALVVSGCSSTQLVSSLPTASHLTTPSTASSLASSKSMNMMSIYPHQSYLSDHQQQHCPSNHLLTFNNKKNRAGAVTMDINNPTIKALISIKSPRQAPYHYNLNSSTNTTLLVSAAVQRQMYSTWISMTMEYEPMSLMSHSASPNPSLLNPKHGSILCHITPASHLLRMPHL